MNSIDIAKHVKWKEVYRALRYFYPSHKWGKFYESVFNKVADYEVDEVEKGIYLTIHGGIYPELKEDVLKDWRDWQSYGISIKKPGEVASWSLSFQRWKYLSSIPYELDTIHRYSPEELLAHFIYEITWYGDERENQKIGRNIMKSAHDAMSEIKKKK